MEISSLLNAMVAQGASDLFLTVGAPPTLGVEGRLQAVSQTPLEPAVAHSLIYSVLNDDQTREFEETLELNMALHIPDLGRFRINVYRQRGQPAMAIRYISNTIPKLEELGLPEILRTLAMEKRGLVLVVGATGTGKSTTLASMIDLRAHTQDGHILTIEDPVEFLHKHSRSLIDQREVGLDTLSYANALKNALRETPDTIMIGEIRDIDTMRHALNYAETGHLCLSTLHASNAYQTLERVLAFYPEIARKQVLMDLSQHLRAIISQRLTIGLDGKRVAAVEIMINTPFISELISQGKIDEIHGAMAQSSNHGCQTFDEALYKLWEDGRISQAEALHHADSRNNMALRFRLDQNLATTPIHKEVHFRRDAPFALYHSFHVVSQHFEDPKQKTLAGLLGNALREAMTARGFRENSDSPDLELMFDFDFKQIEDFRVEPIAGDDRDNPLSSSHTEGNLVLTMHDCRTGKPVWRLNARTELDLKEMTQAHIDAACRSMMEDFPPVG